jgi:hypothetical protein
VAAPPPPPAAQIPTLSSWGMVMLFAGLVLTAVAVLKQSGSGAAHGAEVRQSNSTHGSSSGRACGS